MTTSCFCRVLQATSTLLQKRGPWTSLRPSPQMGSRPSCRELCPVQNRAVWWEVVAAAAQNRATATQHRKRGSLCSNVLPAPLLFSSTVIPFGTDQDLAADYSKIRAVASPGGSYSIFWALLTPFATSRGEFSLRAPVFWGAQCVSSYPQQLVHLLRESFGCDGRLLWGGSRNLGFASDTESYAQQE